jgi:hypothetical protein
MSAIIMKQNHQINKLTQYYEPCFSKCKTCEYQGDDEINNCTSCRNNYIFMPKGKETPKCVLKSQYYYYFIFNSYYCTEIINAQMMHLY